MATILTSAAAKAVTMINGGLGLRSCSRGIGRARLLEHLKIYGEYDRLLECLQVSSTDGNGNGGDEQ